jgi:hypothetical protein
LAQCRVIIEQATFSVMIGEPVGELVPFGGRLVRAQNRDPLTLANA